MWEPEDLIGLVGISLLIVGLAISPTRCAKADTEIKVEPTKPRESYADGVYCDRTGIPFWERFPQLEMYTPVGYLEDYLQEDKKQQDMMDNAAALGYWCWEDDKWQTKMRGI